MKIKTRFSEETGDSFNLIPASLFFSGEMAMPECQRVMISFYVMLVFVNKSSGLFIG